MKKYSKSILMVVATILTALLAALGGDSIISPQEWVNVAILGVGACSVFAAPNVPGAVATKAIIAVLTAVLSVLSTVILGGIGTVEIIQMGVAALAAVGVYATPNKGSGVTP